MRLRWIGPAALCAALLAFAGAPAPAAAQTGPQNDAQYGFQGGPGGPDRGPQGQMGGQTGGQMGQMGGQMGGGPMMWHRRMMWHHMMWDHGERHDRMHGAAAEFRFRRGQDVIDIRCPDDEPVQACVNAATALMDKVASMPQSAGPGAPGTPPGH